MYRAGYRAAWLSALFLPSVQLISAFVVGGIVWYGGAQAQYGGMTIGSIQAFVSYVTFMMWPVQDLARIFAEIQHAIASAERIFSLLDAVPTVSDRPDAFDPGTIHGDIEISTCTSNAAKPSPWLVQPAAANRPSLTWPAASTNQKKA
jgi:ATP-binding cassette subfamily B protein